MASPLGAPAVARRALLAGAFLALVPGCTGSLPRQPATFVEETWQNANDSIGGLFRSCSFVRGARFFLVDAAVFQPREKKLPILREVAAVAETFGLAEDP